MPIRLSRHRRNSPVLRRNINATMRGHRRWVTQSCAPMDSTISSSASSGRCALASMEPSSSRRATATIASVRTRSMVEASSRGWLWNRNTAASGASTVQRETWYECPTPPISTCIRRGTKNATHTLTRTMTVTPVFRCAKTRYRFRRCTVTSERMIRRDPDSPRTHATTWSWMLAKAASTARSTPPPREYIITASIRVLNLTRSELGVAGFSRAIERPARSMSPAFCIPIPTSCVTRTRLSVCISRPRSAMFQKLKPSERCSQDASWSTAPRSPRDVDTSA
mmetsp:Transcript_26444/g.61092  ORF Transcript_26444/g.61092 Transcript_26444/m.61092 type:complete len:281 (+) Transcript_26444:825-1667(+)